MSVQFNNANKENKSTFSTEMHPNKRYYVFKDPWALPYFIDSMAKSTTKPKQQLIEEKPVFEGIPKIAPQQYQLQGIPFKPNAGTPEQRQTLGNQQQYTYVHPQRAYIPSSSSFTSSSDSPRGMAIDTGEFDISSSS